MSEKCDCDCGPQGCGPDCACESGGCGCDATAARRARIRRLGVGAALVALPLASIPAILHLQASAEKKKGDLEKQFTFDDSAHRAVDPSLIKFREVGRIETGLARPKSITVNKAGHVIVSGENVVRVLETGKPPRDIAVEGTPSTVTVADDGSIFVAMRDHVRIFGPDGAARATWASFGPRAVITSIAISGEDVWVADQGRRLLLRCDVRGKVGLEIGRRDEAINHPGLIAPSEHMDVAVDSSGMVWIANPGMHRLEAWSRNGVFQRAWGTTGPAIESFIGCCNPSDFAMLSDGSFVTAEKGMARVKLYTPDGRFDCVVAAPSAFAENMIGLDVAVTSDDKVLVLEPGSRAVRVFQRIEGSGT